MNKKKCLLFQIILKNTACSLIVNVAYWLFVFVGNNDRESFIAFLILATITISQFIMSSLLLSIFDFSIKNTQYRKRTKFITFFIINGFAPLFISWFAAHRFPDLSILVIFTHFILSFICRYFLDKNGNIQYWEIGK